MNATPPLWFNPIERGQGREFSLEMIHYQWERALDGRENDLTVPNQPMIGGYVLPPFQRDFCWTEAQQIKLIESAARRLPLGTWTYNRAPDGTSTVVDGKRYFHYTDLWLIDGQQRITSLIRFFEDAFPVFGYRWSEVPKIEKRRFLMQPFAAFELNTADEAFLREAYNALNFSGTPHRPDQRA
jgi:hypothetical protein